jgi:hypothetical protein
VKQFLDVVGRLGGGDVETQADFNALSTDDNIAIGDMGETTSAWVR